MSELLDELRSACWDVASRAKSVRVVPGLAPAYAAALPIGESDAPELAPDPEAHLVEGPREELAAFWLTLDAINFGSGWFPTLRKRPGRSGYFTIAGGVRDHFAAHGPWTARELAEIESGEIAAALEQLEDHELMEVFARSLRDLGEQVSSGYDGRFASAVDSAGRSAVALVETLARWSCFADVSFYDGLAIPFLKRAQIAAADLARAGVAEFDDLERLTMFADNLVPHVLRLDGLLEFDPALVERIGRGELIEHGSHEEVEIRACALHAVELIVGARGDASAADVDHLLWWRGQQPRYKAEPRHRTRCSAY